MNKASWESIILNLFSNSIKALGNVQRKRKYIKINFEKTTYELKIQVKDNGSGIEEDNFERIFDPLWTSYKGSENAGTGMGITIVREILEGYDGDLWVKTSKYEKDFPGQGGTTMELSISLDKLKED